jgi:Flp pilus assembly protein TadG
MISAIMKTKYLNKRRRRALLCSQGQSLLEFALLLPFLLLLLLGVIEMGRFAYIGILVGNAARAGAAYGIQDATHAGDQPGIKQAAVNDFQNNGLAAGRLNVASEWNNNCGCDNGGTIVATACTTACPTGRHLVVSLSVTASGTYNSLFGFPGIPSPMNITRTATLRIGGS